MKPNVVFSFLRKLLRPEKLSFTSEGWVTSVGRQRCLSSSSRLFSLNIDVSKLTPKDEESILFKINTSSKEELEEGGVLPPAIIEEVCLYRNEHGPFFSLGNVLALPGMGNDLFKKICSTYQAPPKMQGLTSLNSEFLKYFSPSLSMETLERVHTVTSLEVCLDSVCYASATRSREVTDWDQVNLLGSQHSKQTPAQVLEQAVHVISCLPKADIYLLETRVPRKISPQYMPILLFIARLQTAIQMLLTSDHFIQSGQHSMFHVRDLFVMRMFELRVGGERVSGQHIIRQLEEGELPHRITLSADLWRKFHKLSSGVQKERFSNCLLLTTAFLDFIDPK